MFDDYLPIIMVENIGMPTKYMTIIAPDLMECVSRLFEETETFLTDHRGSGSELFSCGRGVDLAYFPL